MLRWLGIPLAIVACSPLDVPATRRPDGGWHLTCGSALEACVKRAHDVCRGRGYVVLGGMSKRELYGAELGVSQVEAVQAELDIACEDHRGYLPIVTSASAPPPLAFPPPPSTSAPASALPAPGAARPSAP